MGKQALYSHEKSSGHKKRSTTMLGNKNISMMLASGQAKSINETPSAILGDTHNIPVDVTPKPSSNANIEAFFNPENILEAEIIWALHNVENHQSLNSVNKTIPVLQKMFKDSVTAQRMKLSSKKLSYLITFGLAPYFEEELQDKLKNCDFYVACFDESFNKIAQRGQMDICLRYWDNTENIVKTRYYTSVFMNEAKADNVLECFKEGLKPLSLHKLLQISMDGPNVNWKFLRLLQEDENVNILDLGSCGLHVVHGAFQAGHKAANWAVNDFLRGIYWLFKNSPARRAAYRPLTDSDEFPLKFCSVRWVESVSAACRALQLLDNIKKYVLNTNTKLPDTTTTKNCKIAFFATIATSLECFLKQFQSAAPLVPFLNILKPLSEVDIGFRTKKFLAEGKVTEREKLDFFQRL
ncbi:hypothetical protein NQ315_014705 [Exocentrus adspersus]|uniref:Uncharacterized protein n=1 Tax=Exocentrus adspersus TaxID=1586481 RepID=A0AAV8VDY7_9CUCU|nr:hypothetical protein NQ315_014705 [Exocentrus adspersus]